MSFNDLKIEEYSNHSIAVQGDTRKYKEDLKKLGGKYNGRLRNGPGWVFPKTAESDIVSFIKNGKRIVTAEEAKAGEELSKQRAKEWDAQQGKRESNTRMNSQVARSQVAKPTFGSQVQPTLTEYGAMMNLIKKMSIKIELLEHAVLMLLSDEQKEQVKTLMEPPAKKKTSVVKKIIKSKSKKVDTDTDMSESEEEVVHRKRLMR